MIIEPVADVVLLAGGLGGARLAPILEQRLGEGKLVVVVNVGDDFDWLGLRVCPDLDSVCYGMAGIFDDERGWGRRGDTSAVMQYLSSLGNQGPFYLGDHDVALSLERTFRLENGYSLSAVTADLAARLRGGGAAAVEILPASDDPAPTVLRLAGGTRMSYSRWFVEGNAALPLAGVDLSTARASEKVLDALRAARTVVLAPSNPVASLGAILSLRGVAEAVLAAPQVIGVLARSSRPEPTGQPSLARRLRSQDALLAAVGVRTDVVGHALLLARWTDRLIVDQVDRQAVQTGLDDAASQDRPRGHFPASFPGSFPASFPASPKAIRMRNQVIGADILNTESLGDGLASLCTGPA